MEHLDRLSLEKEMNLLITFIEDSKRHIKNLKLEFLSNDIEDGFREDFFISLNSEIGFREELIKFAKIRLEKIEEKIGLFK